MLFRSAGDALNYFKKTYAIYAEHGDFPFACHALNNTMDYPYMIGSSIDKAFREYVNHEGFIKTLKDPFFIDYFNDHVRFYKAFKGETDSPLSLDMKDSYMEKRLAGLRGVTVNNLDKFAFLYRLIKLNYLHGNYPAALTLAREIEDTQDVMVGTFMLTEYTFYYALSIIKAVDGVTGRARSRLLKKFNALLVKMKIWAVNCQANFLHKCFLLEAELARLNGETGAAMILYNKSILSARENGYVQNEGIANERLAEICIEMENRDYAQMHVANAARCFREWGATAKVRQLEEKYLDLLGGVMPAGPAGDAARKMSEVMDLSTIMNSVRIISSERSIASLFKNGMKMSLHASGAQRIVLMMENPQDGLLYIQAEHRVGSEPIVLQSKDLTEDVLPLSIVNYVSKTRENIILHDAIRDVRFAGDPYIEKNRSRSILCVPIRNKGKVTATVYLENNLAPGVFTAERQRMLTILSSQAAIVMENLRLASVEKQNAVLEHEIDLARNIQKSLLPQKLPDVPGVSLAYKCVPMLGVGGDFCDYYYDEDTNNIGFFICDVSGHGVYAAILASMVNMGLYKWKILLDTPVYVLKNLDEMLRSKIGNQFLTACACCLDIATGQLTVASAGHMPVAVVRKNGCVEFVKAKGSVINSFFSSDYQESAVMLDSGDTVLLYTDGLTEAMNAEGYMLGEDQLKLNEWIASRVSVSDSMADFCHLLYQGVLTYSGKKDLDDDFTVLTVRWHADSKHKQQ